MLLVKHKRYSLGQHLRLVGFLQERLVLKKVNQRERAKEGMCCRLNSTGWTGCWSKTGPSS